MDTPTLPLQQQTLLTLLVPTGNLSFSDLGSMLGVTKAAVHQWTREGYVPAERVEQVADRLGLRAEVRDELRRRARLDVRLGLVGRVALTAVDGSC